ncbi:MFS transporter [Pseudomonas silvicola]|nr:MFS transporter [Pseudomonas silvicola]
MPSSSRNTALLWIVASGFFMQTLDTTIVNTALPSMASALGENPLDMLPVVVAYSLTMAMLTPASGWLADRFGTRRIYFLAILLFVIGSVLCAASQSLPELVLARVVQGIGGSMLLPIGRLAVLRSVTGEQYIAALAMVSVAGQVGPLIGPVLGGWISQTMAWNWIFLINIPIGLLGMAAVRRFLTDDALEQPPPFDFVGCGLLSLCMAAFSLALDVPGNGHQALLSGGLFGIALLAALCYIPHARRRQNPLFSLALFGQRNFSVGLIGNLLCRIGSGAVPFLLPLLMQLQLGYSPLHSGLMLLPAAIGGILSKRWVVPLVKHFGYNRFLLVNTVLVGASIASFGLISPGWPLALEIAQIGLFGCCNSMQFAAMNSVTLKGLGARDAGSGNSLFSMVQILAIGLGVIIGGGVVNLLSASAGEAAVAYRWAFIVVGLFTLASGVIFRALEAERQVAAAR